MIPKNQKITRRKDYQVLFQKGKSWSNKLVALKVLPNVSGDTRYGLALSRRLGGAVERNRVKRWLRESIRSTTMEQGWDILFIARNTTTRSDYHTLRAAVEGVLRRASLIREKCEREST